MSPSFSRRDLFKVGALALTAGVIGTTAPHAAALGPVRGTIIDFSAGVPFLQSNKADIMLANFTVTDDRQWQCS